MSRFLEMRTLKMTLMTMIRWNMVEILLKFDSYHQCWTLVSFECSGFDSHNSFKDNGDDSTEKIIAKAKEEARAEDDPVKVSPCFCATHFWNLNYVFWRKEKIITQSHIPSQRQLQSNLVSSWEDLLRNTRSKGLNGWYLCITMPWMES